MPFLSVLLDLRSPLKRVRRADLESAVREELLAKLRLHRTHRPGDRTP